jgi:hypothetical protein
MLSPPVERPSLLDTAIMSAQISCDVGLLYVLANMLGLFAKVNIIDQNCMDNKPDIPIYSLPVGRKVHVFDHP